MIRFNLAARIVRPSRRPIDLVAIKTTTAQAVDLAAIYARALKPWDHAEAEIGGVYARELARRLQTDAAGDIGGAIDDLADVINRLVLELTPSLREWAFRMEAWHRGKWIGSILARAAIDLSTIIGPQDMAETIDAFIARNTALVRDVSDEARGRIADSVFRGFQNRTAPAIVGKEISEAVGMGRARAKRIAADQAVKLSSAMDAERQRQAGIGHWKWNSSHKLHFRPEHQARDGKVYTDATAPNDLPGQLPYCGCVRQGIIVFDEAAA